MFYLFKQREIVVFMPLRIDGSENCNHDDLVNRGRDSGDNKYLYCRDCGAIIVVEEDSESDERIRSKNEEEESDPIKRLVKRIFNK